MSRVTPRLPALTAATIKKTATGFYNGKVTMSRIMWKSTVDFVWRHFCLTRRNEVAAHQFRQDRDSVVYTGTYRGANQRDHAILGPLLGCRFKSVEQFSSGNGLVSALYRNTEMFQSCALRTLAYCVSHYMGDLKAAKIPVLYGHLAM